MPYQFPQKIFPTAINQYLLCPFKFKCSNDKDIKAEFVESPESFVGKVIHESLKDFFDITKTPINERNKRDAGETVRHHWARMSKNGVGYWTAEERIELFGSREQERAFGLKTVAVLANYLSSADLSVVPLALEDWMECGLGEFRIAGRIDRIDQSSSESISVWDYKTGKLPFYNSIDKIIEEDLQIPFYALISSRLYPFAKNIKTGLIYVQYSKTYQINWSLEQLRELENKVLEAVGRAKSDTELLPRANKLCSWCEYREVCPKKGEITDRNNKIEEADW